eukprot:c24981_g2_i5 orf=57-311(-)
MQYTRFLSFFDAIHEIFCFCIYLREASDKVNLVIIITLCQISRKQEKSHFFQNFQVINLEATTHKVNLGEWKVPIFYIQFRKRC